MQLLTAKQAANEQLQLQMQQNQVVQIAHTNTLKTLAETTEQRNFDNIFASISIYDGTEKEGFFKWIERLAAACLQSRRDIHTEALGKAGGDIKTCLMDLPMNVLLSLVQQELKRCFSNLPTACHTAVHLNTITQKPSESLHI